MGKCLSIAGAWMQDKPNGPRRWFGRASVEGDLGSDHIRRAVGPHAYSLSSLEVQKTRTNVLTDLYRPLKGASSSG
jgi:hypothetical protein